MVDLEVGITVVAGDEDGTADSVTLGAEEVLGARLVSIDGTEDGLNHTVGL